jgi:hypothetical protein
MARRKKEDENSHLVDLDNLIGQVIDAGLDPSVFDVELDVEYAKNIVDFALSPEFMNTKLWAKQAEQAIRLFCEYCPGCSDMDFLDDVPVDAAMGTFRSKVVLLEHGICPECKKNKCELFDQLPFELVSCLGQRSGKTALTGGVIAPYYIHRFLQLPNPTRFYGLMSNTFFQLTFVAVTATQAYETLWSAFKGAISSSPWFKDYIKKLKAVEKERGFEKGTLVKVMDSVVWFGNKQLGCSYAAADMKSLRGRTRVFAGIDELGWFNTADSKRANSDETYAALSNSLRTIRSSADILWKRGEYMVLPGFMANISSPSSQYDKIMRLLKEGDRDKRKVCFHMSSWEASPLISRESLSSEETNNPVHFWRDFGAIPPLANNPFIESERAIKDMQTSTLPLFRWKSKYVTDQVNSEMRYVGAELLGQLTDRMTPRLITVDGGEKQNSFAICCFSMERTGPDDEFNIILDAAIEAKPEKIVETGEVIPVHFPTMFKIVLALSDRHKGLNVRAVLYDRWQSTGEVQRLRDMRVKAERYSPREQDFKTLRNLVYQSNFKTPRWEYQDLSELDVTNIEQLRRSPYTHLAVQFATVREVGKKVVKPEVGDDDLWRACVLGTHYLVEHKKEFLTTVARKKGSGMTVGSVAFKSGTNTFQGTRTTTNIGSVKGKFRY